MASLPIDLSHVLPYEATFFDDGLAVERNDLEIPALLGVDGEVPDELLVSLCGAPTGSTIEAYLEDATRLTFEVTNPTFIASANKVSIIRRMDGDVLELGKIDLLDDAIPGLGAVMLWRIARACDAFGIARITAYAVGGRKAAVTPGGPRLSGYYAWPRFGFDAAIPDGSSDEAALFQYFRGYPDGLADGRLQSLRALFGARLGRCFWRVAGTERWMTFDVAPQSQSVLTLGNYLKEKGNLRMSEKLATTGEFRVARPASKRSRWWIRQRPRWIEAKIERLVDKAVADRLERIELEHRALWPDSTRYGTMKGIVKILHTIGGGDVIMQVGEMTRPYQSPKPLVGGLLYDLDITGNTKGQFQVSPVQAAEASQTKVFKVARIDRSKAQLPEVSVADAEASGRRKTRALFGLPEDE